jgi:hypothetical protein
MRRFAVMVRVVFVLVVPALGACGRDSTEPSAAFIADGNYFIRGTITETNNAWGYIVKAASNARNTEPSAAFTLASDVVIRRADGSPASKADLQVGKTISVWITGIVLESLPVQVTAKTIVID